MALYYGQEARADLNVMANSCACAGLNAVANSRACTDYRCRAQIARPHRLTTPRTTCPSALAAGSRVRAGLQRGGQLARPHRLKNTMVGLSVCSRGRFTREGFQFHLVIINFMADYFSA